MEIGTKGIRMIATLWDGEPCDKTSFCECHKKRILDKFDKFLTPISHLCHRNKVREGYRTYQNFSYRSTSKYLINSINMDIVQNEIKNSFTSFKLAFEALKIAFDQSGTK